MIFLKGTSSAANEGCLSLVGDDLVWSLLIVSFLYSKVVLDGVIIVVVVVGSLLLVSVLEGRFGTNADVLIMVKDAMTAMADKSILIGSFDLRVPMVDWMFWFLIGFFFVCLMIGSQFYDISGPFCGFIGYGSSSHSSFIFCWGSGSWWISIGGEEEWGVAGWSSHFSFCVSSAKIRRYHLPTITLHGQWYLNL